MMSWTKAGILVTLTLVATTLGSGAGSGSVSAAQQGPVSSQSDTHKPGVPSRSHSDHAPAGAAPMIQAACAPDAWKSASARPLAQQGGHGLAKSACLSRFDARPHVNHGWEPQAVGSVLNGDSARAWLACRYPNGPPSA